MARILPLPTISVSPGAPKLTIIVSAPICCTVSACGCALWRDYSVAATIIDMPCWHTAMPFRHIERLHFGSFIRPTVSANLFEYAMHSWMHSTCTLLDAHVGYNRNIWIQSMFPNPSPDPQGSSCRAAPKSIPTYLTRGFLRGMKDLLKPVLCRFVYAVGRGTRRYFITVSVSMIWITERYEFQCCVEQVHHAG